VLDPIVLVDASIRLVLVQTERSMFITFDTEYLHSSSSSFVDTVGGDGSSLL